jgi:bacterioferritin-associated ferredoxin
LNFIFKNDKIRAVRRSAFEEPRVIVCQCNGVSDRSIRRAVRGGASSCREIARICNAGTFCGGCRPAIAELIREEQSDAVAEAGAAGLVAAAS